MSRHPESRRGPAGPEWAWGVLGLVFVDEVLAVIGAGVWGAYAWGAAGAIGVPVAALVLWWTFASPRAPYGGPLGRPMVKILVFGGASIGLWVAGYHGLAVALFAFSVVVNAVAQTPSARAATAASRS